MKKFVALAIIAALFSGCTNSDVYSGDVYTGNQAKQAQFVNYGTITAVRAVKIQTNADSDGSTSGFLGSVGGAVLGGLLGNTIGGGSGRHLATAAGAIAGMAAGSKLEDGLSQTNALEIQVRQENGSNIVVVQKASPNQFHVGQAVRIITDGNKIIVAPR
ncbi:glycine zipper 2TM domain-containing protein [Candidatus Schmidhempelia bombi]|jgi:outer membrane lipoprotein SlyB|uniref:Glycine zipper 2TM domain-containing protein n=1 Tax=Candidatus Schmidhempelia bombi str. Bimp TaxID=1387197 RepID=A0AB94ICX5_9GAMM|nr:glycine zipper 2TM domain-containing protein [Candidatus Schmidhempelia bombi]TEA27275.1 glycine zipper 2TM domain-containing protein [Candidatus Schmidhempelia bombi str. Bimp]